MLQQQIYTLCAQVVTHDADSENQNKLVSCVGDWMTPVGKIVAAPPSMTAQDALELMQEKSVRHLVISHAASDTASSLQDPNLLRGVVSVSQIVALLQSDGKKVTSSAWWRTWTGHGLDLPCPLC